MLTALAVPLRIDPSTIAYANDDRVSWGRQVRRHLEILVVLQFHKKSEHMAIILTGSAHP